MTRTRNQAIAEFYRRYRIEGNTPDVTEVNRLSTKLDKIIGYRNDTLSTIGANRLLLADIIDYETLDLGNSDIPDYVQHTYPEWQLNPSMTGKDIEQIIRHLWHLPKTAKLYGIWLTKTKRDVAAYYADESPNITITTYVLPQTALVLSDLGPEGLLYVIPKSSDTYYANEKTYLLSKTDHLIDGLVSSSK